MSARIPHGKIYGKNQSTIIKLFGVLKRLGFGKDLTVNSTSNVRKFEKYIEKYEKQNNVV